MYRANFNIINLFELIIAAIFIFYQHEEKFFRFKTNIIKNFNNTAIIKFDLLQVRV